METLYSRVKKFALKKAKNESVLFILINLLYRLFIHEIMDAVISILGTVVIGIMIGVKYYGVFFYICIGLYSSFLILVAFAKKYQHEKLIENRTLKQSLSGINGTLRAWSIELQKSARTIYGLKRKKRELLKNSVASINFQSAAFVVCENLKNNLTKYYDNDNIYVTIFQKQKKDSKEFCKMIAYSEEKEPSTYGDSYKIPKYEESLLGKIDYHSYLFAANSTDISALPDPESVEKCFVKHKKSAERENNIQQYIGIPIAPANLGVTFILQIDTNIPYLFGKNKEEIISLVKTAVFPFAQFLHMVYEQSRTIEQLIGGGN